ncbi:hypothetical protein Ancab_029729, partial [Ancistrocladus abbreviatus]
MGLYHAESEESGSLEAEPLKVLVVTNGVGQRSGWDHRVIGDGVVSHPPFSMGRNLTWQHRSKDNIVKYT